MKALPLAKPPFGCLRVTAPDKFEAVYLNGKFMGHAGEFNNSMQGLLLSPGEYAVKVVPVSGGDGHEEKVKIEADKTILVRAEKQARFRRTCIYCGVSRARPGGRSGLLPGASGGSSTRRRFPTRPAARLPAARYHRDSI